MPSAETSGWGGRLPDLLRAYRVRALLTQEELARRTGLSSRTIRRLECGALERPRISTVRLLADELLLNSAETDALVRAASGDDEAKPDAFRAPDMLPPDITHFTGRAVIVAQLSASLLGDSDGAGGRDRGAGRLVGLSGAPGVGKTALAMHLGHRLRAQFPDGRLYLDLHGLADRPLPVAEALARLLSFCLGPGASLPEDEEERAALLRAWSVDRRVLIILDNAQSEAQVRPLLPAASGCAVLVTSRRTLPALDTLAAVDLGLFRPEEAVRLLDEVVGHGRVAAEQGNAARIAELCGRLPLAVRIAAARLAARPHWTLAQLSEQLADEHRRLDALTVGDRAVRASLQLSYQSLPVRVRRLLHLLAALTDTDVPGWTAGPLLDLPTLEAQDVLEELVDARLVEVHGTAGGSRPRYGMHSLVRLFARERAELHEAPELPTAAERLLGAWLAAAEEGSARLPGGLQQIATGSGRRYPIPASVQHEVCSDTLPWFERERLALTAAVRTGALHGLDELVWDLVGSFGRFLELTGDLTLWEYVLHQALQAARRAGNRRAEAHLLRSLGEVGLDRDQYSDARDRLTAALAIFTDTGERAAVAHVERALGALERIAGDNAAAAVRLERALAYLTKCDDLVGRADTLFSLGAVRRDQGRNPEALVCYEQALDLENRLGNRLNQVLLMCSIGSALLAQGRVADARAVLTRGLGLARDVDTGEAFVLTFLGDAETRAEDFAAASTHLTAALVIFRRSGNRYGEAITLRNLGELQRVRRQFGEAYSTLRDALALWDELGGPLQRARTLTTLGRLQSSAGDRQAARVTWEEAAALFDRLGSAERQDVCALLVGTELSTG